MQLLTLTTSPFIHSPTMSAVATRTAMLATLRVATDKGRGEYDLPAAAQDAFQDILQEPRLVIPPAVKCAAASVHITGNAMPFLSASPLVQC